MRNSSFKRPMALVASAAVTTAGLVAFAPSATAVSAELKFDCQTAAGASVFTNVTDTDLPASVPFGKTVPVNVTSKVTVPATTVDLLRLLGATTVEGTSVSQSTLNGNPLTTTVTVPTTPVPATGPLVVNASGKGADFTATTLGDNVLKMVEYTSTLKYLKADGTELSIGSGTPVPCKPQAGQDLTIDTVKVVQATTTTALAISGNTATATVTSNGGTPAGSVDFVVNGQTISGAVANGKATATLPALPVGTYPVTATFKPTNAQGYATSTATGSYQGTVPAPSPTVPSPTVTVPPPSPTVPSPTVTVPPPSPTVPSPTVTVPPPSPTNPSPTVAPPTTQDPFADLLARLLALFKKLGCKFIKC